MWWTGKPILSYVMSFVSTPMSMSDDCLCTPRGRRLPSHYSLNSAHHDCAAAGYTLPGATTNGTPLNVSLPSTHVAASLRSKQQCYHGSVKPLIFFSCISKSLSLCRYVASAAYISKFVSASPSLRHNTPNLFMGPASLKHCNGWGSVEGSGDSIYLSSEKELDGPVTSSLHRVRKTGKQ